MSISSPVCSQNNVGRRGSSVSSAQNHLHGRTHHRDCDRRFPFPPSPSSPSPSAEILLIYSCVLSGATDAPRRLVPRLVRRRIVCRSRKSSCNTPRNSLNCITNFIVFPLARTMSWPIVRCATPLHNVHLIPPRYRPSPMYVCPSIINASHKDTQLQL